MTKTEQVIADLKDSVGSYFWEKTIGDAKTRDSFGTFIFCNSHTLFYVEDKTGHCHVADGIQLTLDEAKSILKTYATAWERATPEGVWSELFKFKSGEGVIRYGGLKVRVYESIESKGTYALDFSGKQMGMSENEARAAWFTDYDLLEVAGDKARSMIHDHLKSKLNPA